jgi:hypothetical protein
MKSDGDGLPAKNDSILHKSTKCFRQWIIPRDHIVYQQFHQDFRRRYIIHERDLTYTRTFHDVPHWSRILQRRRLQN